MGRPPNTRESIEARVEKAGPDDCWNWTGHLDDDGYPRVTMNRVKMLSVNRLMLEWYSGIAGGSLYVLHSCDNRKCCNPSHLRWGTAKDNADDRESRGRGVKGNKRPDQVKRLSKFFTVFDPNGIKYEGSNLKEFCILYGLNDGNMSRVCRGLTEKHKGWTGYYKEDV